MYRVRATLAGSAAALMVAGMVVAAPANAGPEWSEPQRVDTHYGWQVQVSDDGMTAAWIRVGKRPGPGPVRTAKYLAKKQRWSESKAVPGSAEATEVVLNGDGDTLLIKLPTAYATSTRVGTKNRWRSAQVLATGSRLFGGRLSGDGGTAVWVDPPPDPLPVPGAPPVPRLMSSARTADGTWGAEVEVGELPYVPSHRLTQARTWVALSADASTAAWVNGAAQLVAARAAGGSWGAPSLVQQYSDDPYNGPAVSHVQLSANGSRLLWQSGNRAVLTSTRTSTGWADPTYVMQNDVYSTAMSPNGKVVAYGQRDPDRVRVRRYGSGEWGKPKTLGPSQLPQIVVRNKAVAWTQTDGTASKLRVSLLSRGQWQNATKIAAKALSPALSRKADTLLYAGEKAGGIFSVKR